MCHFNMFIKFSPILNQLRNRRTDADKEYRYLFFYKMTLAVKSSLYPFSSNGSSKGLTITSDMAHALCELHEDLEKYVFFFHRFLIIRNVSITLYFCAD